MTIKIEIPIECSTINSLAEDMVSGIKIILGCIGLVLLCVYFGAVMGIFIEGITAICTGSTMNMNDSPLNHPLTVWGGVIGAVIGIIISLQLTGIIDISCRHTKKRE